MAIVSQKYEFVASNIADIAARTDPAVTVAVVGRLYADVTWDNAIASAGAMNSAMREFLGAVPAGVGVGTPFVALDAGLVGTPTLTIGGATTGLYSPGANQFAIAANGVQASLFTSQGIGFPVGAVGTPGAFVAGDVNSGFYAPAADQVSVAAGGVQAVLFTSQGIGFPAGLLATPGLFLIGDIDAGFYSGGPNQINVGLGSINSIQFRQVGLSIADGALGTPSLALISDSTTGFYRSGAGVLDIVLAGTQNARFTTTAITMPSGSAGTPSFGFTAGAHGIHFTTAPNRLALDIGGAAVVFISSTQARHNVAGTVGAPAWSWDADTDTGFLNQAANAIGVSCGNGERARFDNNTAASETSVLLSIAGAAVQRVSVGANDSGGAGFRLLRVAN